MNSKVNNHAFSACRVLTSQLASRHALTASLIVCIVTTWIYYTYKCSTHPWTPDNTTPVHHPTWTE